MNLNNAKIVFLFLPSDCRDVLERKIYEHNADQDYKDYYDYVKSLSLEDVKEIDHYQIFDRGDSTYMEIWYTSTRCNWPCKWTIDIIPLLCVNGSYFELNFYKGYVEV